MYLNQSIAQTQNLQINMKLVQGMQILQMSAVELHEYLERQSVENPLMEVRYPARASTPGDLLLQVAGKENETLEQALVSQLRLSRIPPLYFDLAEFIAGNLNEDGYLILGLQEIAERFHLPVNEIEAALAWVQAMEPAGVAARSLQECLLLQVGRDANADPCSAKILTSYLKEIAAGRYQAVADQLGLSVERVEAAVRHIRKLNPRPGLAYSTEMEAYIEPDAYVHKIAGHYVVSLNEACHPQVSVNGYYLKLKKESGCKITESFVAQYSTPIRWIIRSLEQRKATIIRVVEAIVEEQRAFLEKGPLYSRPINLRTISDKVSLDVSTVSRAIKDKYVQTPRGIYSLKSFFSTKLESQKEESASPHAVKAIITQLVNEEDKRRPLSDQQITDALVRRGYQISRRTVMKYREALHILSSRLRSS